MPRTLKTQKLDHKMYMIPDESNCALFSVIIAKQANGLGQWALKVFCHLDTAVFQTGRFAKLALHVRALQWD